jgi:uncharacterized protein YegJ (DUF2314 family)
MGEQVSNPKITLTIFNTLFNSPGMVFEIFMGKQVKIKKNGVSDHRP